ncbi:hypothetical protein Smp_180840 [Schistosoma mansoni]|uniref:hypothetical protein n=1 Tax=Schistosoma mansoni TaxID=6183 RepID=UPI0001A62B61|nr:hypothetical protein Smp_180840 [Schistosoma mansoni]|eukprot:XP_018648656.1 hypothetical protein Smp_180840 [Schistosoma mansoni]
MTKKETNLNAECSHTFCILIQIAGDAKMTISDSISNQQILFNRIKHNRRDVVHPPITYAHSKSTYKSENNYNDKSIHEVIVLAEFLLPDNIKFTDRLVTLENVFSDCKLTNYKTALTFQQSTGQDRENCNDHSDVIDLLSPVDGVLIDWEHIDGITVSEFWKLFETVLLNDTLNDNLLVNSLKNIDTSSYGKSWESLYYEDDGKKSSTRSYPVDKEVKHDRYFQKQTYSLDGASRKRILFKQFNSAETKSFNWTNFIIALNFYYLMNTNFSM